MIAVNTLAPSGERWRLWASIAAGGAILLAPAAANGFVFWFHDTASYHLLGRSILEHLAALIAPAAPAAGDAALPAGEAAGGDQNASLTYIGGRAPLYGLLIYLSSLLGSYWFAAGVQALVGAWLISAALRALGRPRLRDFFFVVVAMSAASALPYFAAALMPDVFTGYAFIGAAVILAGGARISLIERAALALALAYAIATHQTNLPLTLMLIVLGGLIGWAFRLPARLLIQRTALAGGALVLALAAGAGYALGVKAVLGAAPSSPPYLMARVLADGPGRLYLHEACAPAPRYALCRYADRPLDSVNDFLFTPDPALGVFMTVDVPTQQALLAEERAFVLGAIARYPLQQAAASIRNALALLPRWQVGEEIIQARYAWTSQNFDAIATSGDARAARASAAFRHAFPLGIIDALNGLAMALAVAFLLWRLTRADVRAALRARGAGGEEEAVRAALAAIAIVLALWLAANAALCGALSGPFPRYQARIAWLAPLLALITFVRLGLGRPPANKL